MEVPRDDAFRRLLDAARRFSQRPSTGNGLTRVEEPEGVWIAYTQDWDPIPHAVFLSELEARRFADKEHCKVRFLRFGVEWHAADSEHLGGRE